MISASHATRVRFTYTSVVSVAVVIAFSRKHSAALRTTVPAEMLAFAESEVARAFDLIATRHPPLVMIEQTFAATPPGAALIDRINGASIQECEVRVVEFADPPNPQPLDMAGTRRAPRFTTISGIEVDLDGKPATLVNISLVGAQVLSASIIKPKQRLRFTAIDQGRGIRIQSVAAAVAVEIVNGAPRYRAGIEFLNADQAALQQFIDRSKQ